MPGSAWGETEGRVWPPVSPAITPAVPSSSTRPDKRLDEKRREARACRRCDLWRDATRVVFGEGPVPARVMLVGEQPGDVEDRRGEPFVGPAGSFCASSSARSGCASRTST